MRVNQKWNYVCLILDLFNREIIGHSVGANNDALIIDAEWARRKNKQLDRLIKKATFKFPFACVEDIEYHADRHLDQAQILRLSTCNYIPENTMLSSWVHRELEKLISVVHWGSQPVEISSAQSTFVCQSY